MNPHVSASSRAPFTVAEADGWFAITTPPARLPFRVTLSSWLLAILPATLLSIYTAIRMPNAGAAFLVVGVLAWLASGWVIARLYAGYHNVRRGVQSHPFHVSTMGIRTPAGNLIPVEQVAAVHLGNRLSGRTVAFAGTGMAAGGALLGAAALDRIATVSYTAEVEHRGQRTVLAGGLTEAQARAVCLEVKQRLAM